jgi:hypothetical protein
MMGQSNGSLCPLGRENRVRIQELDRQLERVAAGQEKLQESLNRLVAEGALRRATLDFRGTVIVGAISGLAAVAAQLLGR